MYKWCIQNAKYRDSLWKITLSSTCMYMRMCPLHAVYFPARVLLNQFLIKFVDWFEANSYFHFLTVHIKSSSLISLDIRVP